MTVSDNPIVSPISIQMKLYDTGHTITVINLPIMTTVQAILEMA